MSEIFMDAIPEIIAFVVIALLTFIGFGIRRLYQFSQSVQKVIERETSNGITENGGSTKDLLRSINTSLDIHHQWAKADAKRMAEHLGLRDD